MFEFIKFIFNLTPAIPIETIKFYHERDNKKLKAMLWKPKGSGPFPLAAFDVGLQYRIWEIPAAAKLIARTGYAVLGTEYSRIEISKGEARDIINAIEYAHKNFNFIDKRTLLVGISMGGATMLNIASKVCKKYNIIGVIAISPYSDLSRAFYYAYGYVSTAKNKKDPRIKLLKLYQKYAYATPQEEPREYYLRSPINFIKNIDCPVIIIHGKKDEVVSVDHSIELYYKMKYLKKDVELILTSGEGIHTPLYTKEMLRKFNFIGFTKTWFAVHNQLKKFLKLKV